MEEAMVATAMVLMSDFGGDFQGEGMTAAGLFLFLSVAVISVFSFISIAVWTEARRKEREAYYKAESLRRVAEMPGDGAKYVVEMMREEEQNRQLRARANEIKQIEGMKIGGLVLLGVGVGLIGMIGALSDKSAAGAVGLIPGLIGVALLVYAFFMAPKPNRN
jgi:hypothetical protein